MFVIADWYYRFAKEINEQETHKKGAHSRAPSRVTNKLSNKEILKQNYFPPFPSICNPNAQRLSKPFQGAGVSPPLGTWSLLPVTSKNAQ